MARAPAPRGRAPQTPRTPVFEGYSPLPNTYDELFDASGTVRPAVAQIVSQIDALGKSEVKSRQKLAGSAFLKGGVTFSVYSAQRRGERIFPFDLIPRVIPGGEWERTEKGLVQRVRALNMFVSDIYGDQRILDEKIVPRDLALGCSGYLEKLRGVHPPHDVHIHIAGIDLIRGSSGEFLVLEDNARTPSGVSYVLENRIVMKRFLSGIFSDAKVRRVDDYPARLREALRSVEPGAIHDGEMAVLTPGPFNSAYFEHSYLARLMGVHLVHNSDLFVHDDRVFVKTTSGPMPISVIYKRIDDDFLDPTFFRPDSLLGVPGLMKAYVKGNVTLANAPGNGVVDDKAIYPFVHDMIRFYLSEEPILGQVETFLCRRPKECAHVIENLDKLVVKAVDASGGYGMLVGPTASEAERSEFKERIKTNPDGYIAQPLVELSTSPTWVDGKVGPRRLDLRPFVLTGKSTWVLPGGLTRVALKEGSYVVNSSQGGGSKDTWVMEGA